MSNQIHRHTNFYGPTGPGNWFGDGSDEHIRVTSAGAESSPDGAIWSPISGWTSSVDTVWIPSVQDGDMIVINAISLQVDAGMTLTTLNRCRGLLIYCQEWAEVNGTLSMTARGCHANPADSTATADTPVAPSDGNAVSTGGIVFARFISGFSDSGTSVLQGCGLAAVNSESNQPEVVGNGKTFVIPRVGGLGAPGNTGNFTSGNTGGTATNGTGGGGSGGTAEAASDHGGNGTCFSGGVGSGGADKWTSGASDNFGGTGGPARDSVGETCGGTGNPGGPGVDSGGGNEDGFDGTGGALYLITRDLRGSGTLEAKGVNGNGGTQDVYATVGGGASGGGLVLIFASEQAGWSGSISADGGIGEETTTPGRAGGNGGSGSIIGPIEIDK